MFAFKIVCETTLSRALVRALLITDKCERPQNACFLESLPLLLLVALQSTCTFESPRVVQCTRRTPVLKCVCMRRTRVNSAAHQYDVECTLAICAGDSQAAWRLCSHGCALRCTPLHSVCLLCFACSLFNAPEILLTNRLARQISLVSNHTRYYRTNFTATA